MKKKLSEIKKQVTSLKLRKNILSIEYYNEEAVLNVHKDSLLDVVKTLKEDENVKYNQLVSICGVDYPQNLKRFQVVYNLLSMKNNTRLRVVVSIGSDDIVPSLHEIFKSAIWYEREIWDMYGIMFANNPDLRRILSDYNFEGHPLRKDFPLSGHLQVRYDLERKKVVYEPVSLDQDFRNFDFMSPWEGTKTILPGDEKATQEKDDSK